MTIKHPEIMRFARYGCLGVIVLITLAVAIIPRITDYKWILVDGPSVNVKVGLIGPIFPRDLHLGDYVMLVWKGIDPNGIERLRSNTKLVKKVGCLPGQYLKVTMHEADCNGIKVGNVRQVTKEGKPLTPALYDGIIPEGRLFLLGEHYFSYDSRYFGLVPYEWIQGKITVVL